MIRKQREMQVETRERMREGKGSVTIRHYFKADELTARSRLCAHLTLPPGSSIGVHEHKAEDEVYIILSGRGELDDGSTRKVVSAGDAVLTGDGESHAIENTGDTPLEMVAVIMCY